MFQARLPRRQGRTGRLVTVITALGLVVAACGGGSGATQDPSDGAEPTGAATTGPSEAPAGGREALLAKLPAEVRPLTEDIPDLLLELLVQVREQGPKELVWVDAGGEVHEGWSQAFLDDWEAITGWTVIEAAPGLELSTSAVQAQVDSGNVEWDVFAILDYGTGEKLAKDGYWEKLDYKYFDIAAVPDVAFFSDPEGNLVKGGSTTDIPAEGYYVGASDYGIVLQWNPEVFAGATAPTSTLDFYDTERFPGKRCAFNWAQFGGNLEFAAMANGATWDTVYDVLGTPDGLQAAFDKLDTIYDDIVWASSGADSIQFLLDGQCDIGITYNGRPAMRVKQEPDLPVAITWGGSIINGGPFAIPKGAPNYDAAQSVYALSMLPSRQCAALNAIGYGVVMNAEPFPGCLDDFGKEWAPQYDKAVGLADPYFFADRPEVEERWAEWQSSH